MRSFQLRELSIATIFAICGAIAIFLGGGASAQPIPESCANNNDLSNMCQIFPGMQINAKVATKRPQWFVFKKEFGHRYAFQTLNVRGGQFPIFRWSDANRALEIGRCQPYSGAIYIGGENNYMNQPTYSFDADSDGYQAIFMCDTNGFADVTFAIVDLSASVPQ